MHKIISWGQKAFTVLEIIMVITIMGIMAVLVINRITGTAESRINLAAEKIVSDIRYCQNLAMALHEEVRLSFSIPEDKYEVKDSSGKFFKDPFTQENFVVDFTASGPLRGISIDNVDFNSGNELRFDALGHPEDVGNNPLTSQGRIDISYKGYSKTIVVYPNTGFCKKL